jgi:sialidase-1
MVFDVAAGSSATAGSTYPISFDFRYTDSDGDTHLTDTFRTPLNVESSGGGGLPVLPLLGLGLVVAGGAAFLYRRHR